jgi:hypothetical protein
MAMATRSARPTTSITDQINSAEVLAAAAVGPAPLPVRLSAAGGSAEAVASARLASGGADAEAFATNPSFPGVSEGLVGAAV